MTELNQDNEDIEQIESLDAELSKGIEDAKSLGIEVEELLDYVGGVLKLSKTQLNKLHERLWAFSSRIRQPRKDDGKCNKTPFFHRWDTNEVTSHITTSDARYASQNECKRVYMTLLALLLESYDVIIIPSSRILSRFERILSRPFQPQSLKCVHTGQAISVDDIKQALKYSTRGLGAYEIPVTYLQSLNEGGNHVHTNVGWMKPVHINYMLRQILYKHLEDYQVPTKAINKALDKIHVKSYCTDKVTMPPHYSNRNIRWATWPYGIQYASHYECAMVEMELMAELYEFVGAPKLDDQIALAIAAARGRPIAPGSLRCFVTGRYLEFDDYVKAAISPQGGRSKYHVGHILPLTRKGRHTPVNIAWMSDDGNRIQDNDTVEEIEAKLVDSVEYHLRRDMEKDCYSQSLLNRVERLSNLLKDIDTCLDRPNSE